MHFTTLFLSALAISGIAAKRSCGAPKLTKEQKVIAQNFSIHEAEAERAGKRVERRANIVVDLKYHVVSTSNTASGGYLTQNQLNAQTQALNNAYAPQGVSFKDVGADWIVNSTWANGQDEYYMKKALRKGTYRTLNVYFILSCPVLGYSYYPFQNPSANDIIYDGVVVLSSTVPGGTAPYNMGHTLTHECGHWFGLVHTFGDEDNGCNGNGDYVSDTPREATAAYGCETGRNTCTSDPGVDPITNYMDYSDDPCYRGFSSGQGTRMLSNWNAFRANK